ncbi:unnamed protein product [Calypogeia fissa]
MDKDLYRVVYRGTFHTVVIPKPGTKRLESSNLDELERIFKPWFPRAASFSLLPSPVAASSSGNNSGDRMSAILLSLLEFLLSSLPSRFPLHRQPQVTDHSLKGRQRATGGCPQAEHPVPVSRPSPDDRTEVQYPSLLQCKKGPLI